MATSLSSFILNGIEPILNDWEAFARTIPSARHFAPTALRDHARAMLVSIASDLGQPQTGAEQHAKSVGRGEASELDQMADQHGVARMADGFSIAEVISEYRALRASVLRRWERHSQENGDALRDMTRFNEALDQALTKSVARYIDARERQYGLFDALLSRSPDLNYIVDLEGKLIYTNRAFADVFGSTPSRLQGVSLYAMLAPHVPDMASQVATVIATGHTHRRELKFNVGGRTRAVYEYLLVPALDCDGRCIAVAGSARDVTDRKASEERHRHGANYDHLTKLPNRHMFQELLAREMKHALRTGRTLGLLFIDLDGFKSVNDSLGHDAGDQLLKQVARRIRARIRETDTVARLGGDEFTVILTDVTQASAVEHLAEVLLAELAEPFALNGTQAAISASVGIGLFPDDARTCDQLVKNADAAMYAAKNAGRNCYRFYGR